MISLPDILDSALPADLRCILDRIDGDLLGLTHAVIIEPHDTGQTIEQELGFNPLIHPIDGIPYDHPDFEPYWVHLGKQGGWFTLIHAVGNSGFAYMLLIPDSEDGEFQRLCRA